MKKLERPLNIGIDIGSTTVKAVVMDKETKEVYFEKYVRHHAEQKKTALALLEEIKAEFENDSFTFAVCGSGGKNIAEKMGAYYVQEVVANAAAVRELYPNARTAIELGGQDAKIVFFYYDENAKRLITSDMRMNGSCAGGTGAFIDEIASLLKVPTEGFEELAEKGKTVHSISGRCGVFAKTDIQSLLNQGGRREDIALSALHAIVKQTIGGLAQGLELKAPIIFEGGPLTFNPTLIKVFAERLNLKKEDIIKPENSDTIIAQGAAIAVDELFGDAGEISLSEVIKRLKESDEDVSEKREEKLFFASREECEKWRKDHALSEVSSPKPKDGVLNVYIGIDAGSTTSKFVLMDEDERIIDRFYSGNKADPIDVILKGLIDINKKYENMGIRLNVCGLGTTGYGEMLIAKAFGADFHTVETVSHAAAAKKYVPDVSFILDIGGQDMKAIWVSEEVVTNITLNEACSSGCGSFLENFAVSLGIEAKDIAEAAFKAKHPASLGSRCTVFMNSTIITEQKNGKNRDDIMAGLCRSIIENVFTKVVRIPDKSSLGKRVVVQGGTFKNDAVLRALEQYLDLEVTRAPFPGEMGAVGAALLTKQHTDGKTNFIGFEGLEDFSYTREDNNRCSHCANHCSRSIVRFSNGEVLVTGNRCPKGEMLDDGKTTKTKKVTDLFLEREHLLFKKYECKAVSSKKGKTVGLPRALEFWDSMPFWTTFFNALGYDVKISPSSTRAMFEQGIPFVPSDTVCFPAKLVHGHIGELVKMDVDRIFMPMIMEMPPADKEGKSNYVCTVVKGYPLIVKNSEDPEKKWNVKYDTPMFHWVSEKDRKRQIVDYFSKNYAVTEKEALLAFYEGEKALKAFREELVKRGEAVLKEVNEGDGFAVLLAGRPYHTDPLISHDLSRKFTKLGIPVLTVDSLRELNDVNLRYTCAEVTNNFHTRMLSGALIAAKNPKLEYVQIVSFGCGHDAILSDEIIRIMKEVSKKSPLVLKLDEGGAANSLDIRIKSFVETVRETRLERELDEIKELPDAYPVKFTKEDKKIRTVLVPNVSVAFCKLLSAVLSGQGLKAVPMELGSINEIRLGKKYVHNDTCFPAQMCIGEAISALQSGKYNPDEVAIGMAKYQGDCRLTHYSALLRRALDTAGFKNVPIVSTDPLDSKEMHPGTRLGNAFNVASLWTVDIMDILEELRRKIRPYEINKGETNRVFDESIDLIAKGLEKGTLEAIKAYKKAVKAFCDIKYDRSVLKPRVFVTGEYLVTYHPGSNFHIEEYLEQNGMEVIFPRMINVFRKDYMARVYEMDNMKVKYPADVAIFSRVAEKLFDLSQHILEKEALKHPLFEKAKPLSVLAGETEHIMSRTFLSGEGWLIPGEIREFAKEGVSSFIILQPFGCLPNHICGRGIMKKIKEEFPAVQILPLDLDPDTSFANVENRLQMLIMNEKSRHMK